MLLLIPGLGIWIAAVVHLLATDVTATPTTLTISSGQFLEPSGPIQLEESVSSVIAETVVSLRLSCFVMCALRRCAILVLRSGGLCQLIVVNDASATAGPPDSHVPRLVGAEPGDQVWKVSDLQKLLNDRKYGNFVFKNSSTGPNGTIQALTISLTGCYRIEAFGAKGGTSAPTSSTPPTVTAGGLGAFMAGSFNLTAGTQLAIVVGQRGGDPSQAHEKAGAGGGGGSFVYVSTEVGDQPLIIAGGGGGGTFGDVGIPGQNGTSGSDTTPCGCNSRFYGFGGTNGQPGIVNVANASSVYYFGGAGAGWLGRAPDNRRSVADGDGGGSRGEAWLGGVAGVLNSGGSGGFGGGGGGGNAFGGSGGGGGFSGGGAGLASHQPGGGGGSYCHGNNGCYGVTGGNPEDQG
uniref:PE-PGRS family protein n=1 Tax=Macrostomum lignano TaxID=282301 RepID=A0A1I8GEH1_9PLAT